MDYRIHKKLLLLVALATLATSLTAAPILWNLTGTFDDGGSASGSFVYDANLNAYSAVNIITTLGSIRTGATHNFVSGGIAPSSIQVLFAANSPQFTGSPNLFVLFNSPLTNGGGVIGIFAQEASCSDPTCAAPTAPGRTRTIGSVSTVPEPGTLTLLSLGGAALGLIRRRSSR